MIQARRGIVWRKPTCPRYLLRDHLVPGTDLLALEGHIEREAGAEGTLKDQLREEARFLRVASG